MNSLWPPLGDAVVPEYVSNTANEHSFPELSLFKQKHNKRLIFSHLNINSLRNKFSEVSEILTRGYVDIFGLSETKINDTFPSAQFKIQDYAMYRVDRTAHGGGLMYYVRSNIPHRLRPDIYQVSNGIESMVLEVTMKAEKCFFIMLYKPPSVSNAMLITAMSHIADKCLTECKTIYLIGI